MNKNSDPTYLNSLSVFIRPPQTPAVPPITHDGIGRGRLRWTLDGRQYTARAFNKGYGEGKYFNLWGRSEEFGPASEVKEVSLVLPQATEKGPLFAGAGTYPLGGERAGDGVWPIHRVPHQ